MCETKKKRKRKKQAEKKTPLSPHFLFLLLSYLLALWNARAASGGERRPDGHRIIIAIVVAESNTRSGRKGKPERAAASSMEPTTKASMELIIGMDASEAAASGLASRGRDLERLPRHSSRPDHRGWQAARRRAVRAFVRILFFPILSFPSVDLVFFLFSLFVLLLPFFRLTFSYTSNHQNSWDWHAWQLAVACLPAGAVLALALSVRKERERRQSEEEEEKEKAEAAAELPATSSSSSSPSSSTSNSNVALASLAERVATLELALAATAEAVRARRSEGGGGGGKVAPAAAAAAAPRPTPTTTTTRPPPSPYSSFSATAISSAVSRGVSWVGGGRWWKDRRREDG